MENQPYKTKDLGEAAALVVKEIQLIEVERQGSVCWFVFQDITQCELLSKQYFFGKLLINARAVHEASVRLKSMIFNRH